MAALPHQCESGDELWHRAAVPVTVTFPHIDSGGSSQLVGDGEYFTFAVGAGLRVWVAGHPDASSDLVRDPRFH